MHRLCPAHVLEADTSSRIRLPTCAEGGWLVLDDELLEASQRPMVAIQAGADPLEAAHDIQFAPIEFEVAWLLSAYPELRSASWRFDC